MNDVDKNFSLMTWAEMLLQHHDDCFVTHSIFSFLIFNTEAHSTNAQVVTAQVSSSQYDRVCEAVKQLDEVLLKNTEDELRYHQKIKNSHVNYLLKEVSIMSHRHLFSNKSKMNL